ncbi:MAG: FHA domain-containing protein [Deltaproteobacteria bacterium]|nr:FHA domain-containing protein [Deltaproteobacteria bacterium]
MGFVLGLVCPKCRFLNKWGESICVKCMTPLRDESKSVLKEIQVFHINKGGRGLIYSSSSAFSISIGRSGCDICFENDRYLSPVHARIENSIEGLRIVDAGSYNGIFRKVQGGRTIKASDVFICGSQILKFLGVLSGLTPYVLPDGTTFYGSLIPDKEYIMIQQILGSRKMGDLYLRPAPLTIGREKADILFPQDKFLSSTHCSISMTEGGFQITDLNSANGIYLKVRGSEIITDGDILLIGQELIMVRVIQK